MELVFEDIADNLIELADSYGEVGMPTYEL